MDVKNLRFWRLDRVQVDRKLVKQTVMTSVYGVTYVGAREQIKRRLEEKGCITDEKSMFNVSCYAANVCCQLNPHYSSSQDFM